MADYDSAVRMSDKSVRSVPRWTEALLCETLGPMTEEGAAAWAQAILSFVAILASGGLAIYVPRHERKLRREEENRARL